MLVLMVLVFAGLLRDISGVLRVPAPVWFSTLSFAGKNSLDSWPYATTAGWDLQLDPYHKNCWLGCNTTSRHGRRWYFFGDQHEKICTYCNHSRLTSGSIKLSN